MSSNQLPISFLFSPSSQFAFHPDPMGNTLSDSRRLYVQLSQQTGRSGILAMPQLLKETGGNAVPSALRCRQ